jgi:hypothetical protein
VVLDQVYDAVAGCPVPEDPCRCALVYPQAGLYALFDGRLGHGVLDSTSGTQRVTLLINWWREAPRVGAASQEHVATPAGSPLLHHNAARHECCLMVQHVVACHWTALAGKLWGQQPCRPLAQLCLLQPGGAG